MWSPTLKSDSESVALPSVSTDPDPSTVMPSLKVTTPVGVPELGAAGVTVAVNVTDDPTRAGFWLETRATWVGPLAMTWSTFGDVPFKPANGPLPTKSAVIGCVPTWRPEALNLATPASSSADPIRVVPSKNETDPVGVP